MRRSDAATVGEVFKRDGRREAFDRGKLARCLGEALDASGEAVDGGELGDTFAGVVQRALTTGGGRAAWASSDVAQLSLEVLEAAGCTGAAQAWRAVDRARRRWRAPDAERADEDGFTKGRLVSWMADGARVERRVADDVAACVERRLFAAGVTAPGEGLLREWVDHELERRGEASRVGRRGLPGIAPAALRRDLAARRPGDDVLRAAGAALLASYAEREIHDAAVAAAHADGALELGDLVAPARVRRVVVPEGDLDAARLAALRAVAVEPVVVLAAPGEAWRSWPPLERREGLADVELVAADAPGADALLAAVVSSHGGALRGGAVAPASEAWLRAFEVRDDLTLRRARPAAGVVEQRVTLNAAGAALDADGDLEHFTERLARSARLARAAVRSRAAHAGAPAWPDAASVSAVAGLDLPSRGAELAVAGLDVAFELLGATTPRAARRLARRVAAVLPAPLVPASRDALHRFGTLDLARRPHLRDRWPLDASRARFAYDVPRTTPGPLAARLAARLFAPASPWPRVLRPRHVPSPPSSSEPAPRPCA